MLGWGGLIAGGLYALIRGAPESIKAMDDLFFRFYDYSVFEVIDTPKFWDEPDYDPNTGTISSVSQAPAPYTVGDIAAKLNRKPTRILGSLKRLKRMGRALETQRGCWFSKDKAPQNYFLHY
jgi:hypothetical protein